MSLLQPPSTAPLGVNVAVLATDGNREQWFRDCKRFASIFGPRFIGLPDGWQARGWAEQPDPEPREAA